MKKMMAGMLAILVTVGIASSAMAEQHVGNAGHGTWKSEWIYAGNVVGYSPRNIWVDIWVHNLGFHKEVGILWTDNDWYTANWSMADYEMTFADGAERWGIDIAPIGQFMWHRSSAHGWIELNGYTQTIGSNGKKIEYVIFYNDISNGRMYWDNNGGANFHLWVVQPGVNGYTL